jgi:hypothetical protein
MAAVSLSWSELREDHHLKESLMNQLMIRSAVGRVCALAAAPAATVTTVATDATASIPPTGPRHGCGSIAVAARPWKSTVPAGWIQSGDHWIVWWEGNRGACKFAKTRATQLVRTVTTSQAQRGLFQWRGGRCVAQTDRAHERIDPFWKTGCNLTYHPAVFVMVDPDPQYIH